MRPIRLATLALLALVVLAFAGCYSIQNEDVAQKDTIGPVELTTNICDSFNAGCTNGSNTGNGGTNVLLAYRVPAGIDLPATITGKTGPNLDQTVTLTKDQSYTDALTSNTNSAPPSGEHWIGYRGDGPGDTQGQITVDFKLPQPGNGQPYKGPFTYRTVVGVFSGASGDPVQCAADPTTQDSYTTTNGTDYVVCIDSPNAQTYPADNQVPTRDLALAAGADTTTQQNTSATVPFTANFAGSADPSATFDIAASTDAPGVKLTPSTTTLAPATDSSTPVSVAADVPPTTPTGTYDVKLVASNSAGQQRTATAKLVVTLGKPVNLALPFVSGTDAVGQTLSCSNGDWSSSPTSYAIQWTRGGQDIAGATASSYTLTQDDGALLVSCRVVATNSVGDGVPATAGAVRVAQEGGADVNLGGRVSVKKSSNGTYVVNTGITVSCPARLPKSCGGGNKITANAAVATRARSSRTTVVAHGGFAAPSGGKRAIVLHLTHSGSKLLSSRKKLTLVATVTTRNHALQRVVSRKQFTVRAPR